MKVKVLIPFTDKETGKECKKNEIINVTAKRFNEIIKKGKLIEAVDDTPTEKTK